MKNFNSCYRALTLILLTVVVLHSCQKDQPEPETTNILTAEELAEADFIYQHREQGTGALFLSKEEYDKVPSVVIPEWKSMTGVEERSSYVKLPMPPVADQGNEGSCTAFGTGYAVVSYYLNQIKGLPYQNNGALRSPEFLFNTTKIASDCKGAYLTTVLNRLVQTGICSWNTMPYTPAGCTTWPSNAAFQNAATGKIKNYHKLYNPSIETQQLLAKRYPVVISFDIDQAFDIQTKKSPFTWSVKQGTVRGGHVAAVIGYDNYNQRFIVQNSWGTQNHDKGIFYISYALFNQVVKEAYVLEPFM